MTTGEGGMVLHLDGEATPLRLLGGQIWRSRQLLLILARKDFFVRYRRAVFGLLWAVVLPFLQALILAFVLTRVVRIQTGINYAVFVYSGIVVWSFFSNAVPTAATAIVDGADLSTKIYFPRAILPMVSVASNLYGLGISVVLLVLLALTTGTRLDARLLLLPAALLVVVGLTTSFALVFSALHVYFRDVRYLVQAALLAWFYVTPIFYPLHLARGFTGWLTVNPVTGAVELFRAATVGADPGWVPSVYWALGWIVALVAGAAALHRRFNRVFVDLL